MFGETRISVDILESTGYSSWLDFAINIVGCSSTNGVYTYGYEDIQGQRKEVKLELNSITLERLALEEAKIWLPLLSISSFSDYQKLIDDGRMRMHRGDYYIDTVVRNKAGAVVLSRIRMNVDEWQRLISWEQRYKNEYSFIERIDSDKVS